MNELLLSNIGGIDADVMLEDKFLRLLKTYDLFVVFDDMEGYVLNFEGFNDVEAERRFREAYRSYRGEA